MDVADSGGLLAKSEFFSGAHIVQSSLDLETSQCCSSGALTHEMTKQNGDALSRKLKDVCVEGNEVYLRWRMDAEVRERVKSTGKSEEY